MHSSAPLKIAVLLSAVCLCAAAWLAQGRPAAPPAPATATALTALVVKQGQQQWHTIRPGPHGQSADPDTLLVADWRGFAREAWQQPAVVPYDGPETSLEEFFAAREVLRVDGVDYRMSDGVFRAVEGLRVWVAVRPRPAGAAAVPLYLALCELDGKILYAALHRAGTPWLQDPR